MARKMFGVVALALCMCTGCGEKNMDMSAMKMPERPMELDKLDPWVGRWTNTGEMKMGDKTMKETGTMTFAWDCDKRVLTQRCEGEMEGMGKSTCLILYTYDTDAKKFKTYWASSMGDASTGEMTWCDKEKCWCMSGKGKDPMTNKNVKWEGHFKMQDSSTMEYEMTQWDMWGLSKQMTCKGTSKRS